MKHKHFEVTGSVDCRLLILKYIDIFHSLHPELQDSIHISDTKLKVLFECFSEELINDIETKYVEWLIRQNPQTINLKINND